MPTFTPIGVVRTGFSTKFEAPSQPDSAAEERNWIDLEHGQNFELALQDLDGFDHIWLLWWFDRNKTWRPRVIPPRGPAVRRGVFATRSPHRPNPIGLTCVELHSVQGLTLEVGPLDLLDGTPIFDIKPYLRTVDSHPESSLGWVEEVEAAAQLPAPFTVTVEALAATQLAWLKQDWAIDLASRGFPILERDPRPHRTRRILALDDGRFRLACGAWRLYFRVSGSVVTVEEIGKGYSDEVLAAHGAEKIMHGQAQVGFADRFPSRG